MLMKWQNNPEEKTMDPYARLNERHMSNDPFAAARRMARKEEDLPEILRETQQQTSSGPHMILAQIQIHEQHCKCAIM